MSLFLSCHSGAGGVQLLPDEMEQAGVTAGRGRTGVARSPILLPNIDPGIFEVDEIGPRWERIIGRPDP